MKIKKVLPVLALSLALVACGGDKDDNKAETTETPAATSTETMDDQDDMDDKDDMDDASDDQDDMDDKDDMDNASTDENVQSEAKLTAKETVDKAKAEYEGYELEGISYEADDGEYYKVKLFKDNQEVEVYVDNKTGEIIKKEEETDNDNRKALDEKYVEKLEDQLDLALEDAGKDKNYVVDEWSLEMDDGRALLEVNIYDQDNRKDAYDYKIDPESGDILEKEVED
ncbi:MAG: PepSY domain-containing protein [Anaerococcus sp.]|nr:PepSY domain-containing protein [Peptoniphilaceae bacterium]MDY3055498.1 PepSY domain-containing protein [Anaerococcus sp.]